MFGLSNSKKADPLAAYADKLGTPELAFSHLRSGDHVFVGSGCAAPRTLLRALESMPLPPADLELLCR